MVDKWRMNNIEVRFLKIYLHTHTFTHTPEIKHTKQNT